MGSEVDFVAEVEFEVEVGFFFEGFFEFGKELEIIGTGRVVDGGRDVMRGEKKLGNAVGGEFLQNGDAFFEGVGAVVDGGEEVGVEVNHCRLGFDELGGLVGFVVAEGEHDGGADKRVGFAQFVF